MYDDFLKLKTNHFARAKNKNKSYEKNIIFWINYYDFK